VYKDKSSVVRREIFPEVVRRAYKLGVGAKTPMK
jgi:hypothetical protein